MGDLELSAISTPERLNTKWYVQIFACSAIVPKFFTSQVTDDPLEQGFGVMSSIPGDDEILLLFRIIRQYSKCPSYQWYARICLGWVGSPSGHPMRFRCTADVLRWVSRRRGTASQPQSLQADTLSLHGGMDLALYREATSLEDSMR